MATEITTENAALAIPKLVAAKALDPLAANLMMPRLMNRNFETALAQFGDVINVPIPPTLKANAIAEGGTVQKQRKSLGNVPIVLNRHYESTFVIPDVLKALAYPDLISTYMNPAIIAIAEQVEADCLNLYAMLTANAAVGSYNTALTETTIDNAELALFTAKVPQSAPKVMVVSGSGYSQLRQISRFTDFTSLGNNGGGQAIVSGQVGKIKDFNVFRSQLVPVTSSTQTHNLAFVKDALSLVTRRLALPLPGMGALGAYIDVPANLFDPNAPANTTLSVRLIMSYQPNSLEQQFTVDIMYGVGVLRNPFGLEVKS